MAADSGGHLKPLQLEPFIHQVGGHSSMLQLDEDTICKPLISQEHNFYRNAPDCLKEFIPEFKGVTEVTFTEDVDGYLNVTACLPSTYYTSSSAPVFHRNSSTDSTGYKAKHRIRVCPSGNILIESDHIGDTRSASKEKNQTKGKTVCAMNPWVLHCHQEQMKKMRTSLQVISLNEFTKECILLENRVSKFKFPCILDIKMGTRQYWDDASLAKRQSHMAKVASSTSATLGMRISGIQLYHRESGHYICHNKNYGRSLSEDGFHQALHHFLHDGTKPRQNIITALLEKIRKLYDVVQSLNTFRFFTSSLLIIYGGKGHDSLFSSKGHDSVFSSKGHDSVLNNQNNDCSDLITKQMSASDVKDNGNLQKDGKFIENKHLQSRCGYDDAPLCSNDVVAGCQVEKMEKKEAPLVDVCMIDFAHSTQSKMPGSHVVHVGPDEGYLFGLKNLIAHLETLQQKCK